MKKKPVCDQFGNQSKHVLMLAPDCYMIDRRILQEARSLIQAGYRVTLLSGFETTEETYYVQDGIEIHRYKYDWNDERIKKYLTKVRNEHLRLILNKVLLQLINRLSRLKSFDIFVLNKAQQFQSDIVHVHDLPMLRYGVYLAKKWRVPLVFDAHEIYHESSHLTFLRKWAYLYMEKHYIQNTNLFITVNEKIADYFQKIHGKRAIVLMNCADRFKDFDREICRERLCTQANIAMSSKPYIILYQGWISEERNLDTLIRAVAQLPSNIYFCLIGYGYYEEHLKKLVVDNQLGDRVHFLGRIEPENILKLTAGADIGVIPYLPVDLNHKYCSPNKIFEYIQANIPTIAHKLPFMEWLEQNYGVLVTGDFSSVESSVKTLLATIDNTEKLEKMRVACRHAAEFFSWEVESRKLLDAYQKLF